MRNFVGIPQGQERNEVVFLMRVASFGEIVDEATDSGIHLSRLLSSASKKSRP